MMIGFLQFFLVLTLLFQPLMAFPSILHHKTPSNHFNDSVNTVTKPENAAGCPFAKSKRQIFDQNPQRKIKYTAIETTGAHAWKPPGPRDTRGPCPALNALANHGYLDRSGIVDLLSGSKIIADVYGLGDDLSLLLSVYATVFSGDILSRKWSIGGPQPRKTNLLSGILGSILSPILGQGRGLSNSHNKFETDASAGRGDYYLFNGDVTTLQLKKFQHLLRYEEGKPNPNFDLNVLIKHRGYTLEDSISKNPYFWFGPFSGLLVSNAGHCFIPAMMSNFSSEHPNGLLTPEILKSFFSVGQDPFSGKLVYKKGWERIPDNWYRRPKNDYGTLAFTVDLLKAAAVNPGILKVGGNTGTVNSFTGVDIGDITGGAFGAVDLLDPQKLTCFIFRLSMTAIPDLLQGGLVGPVLGLVYNLLNDLILPLIDPKCPDISQYSSGILQQFPGAGLGKK